MGDFIFTFQFIHLLRHFIQAENLSSFVRILGSIFTPSKDEI